MTKIIKWQFLLFALLLSPLFGREAQAKTVNAASCSEAAVAAAVAQAANGDTVVIPACPSGVAWTTGLTVTVGITLQGQGIGGTVLIDNVPKGASNCGGGGPLLRFSTGSNNFRITGFTIQGSAPDPFVCNGGHLNLAATGNAIRVDHLSFVNMQTSGIRTSGCLYGVIDHNTFDARQSSNLSLGHKQGVVLFHSDCGGASNGDYTWSVPTLLGTANFLFLEDNTFIDPQAVGAGAFDGLGGMRIVFRHNTASFVVGHGTESGGRQRGMRAFEVYDNTFTPVGNPQFAGFYVRSGTGVIHDNTFVDSGVNSYNGFISLANDRDSDSFAPWGVGGASGACDGTGPYDKNAGTVFATGTASSSSSANNLVASGAPGWTANQWVGSFTIRNVTQHWGALIDSNTSTTIVNRNSAFGQSRSWASGDIFQVLSAYPCIDQVGRGAGTLLGGSLPAPLGWVNEASEPVYQWNNTHNGVGGISISSPSTRILEGRDYFDNTPMPGYTPYIYPHPLVTASGPPPPAPLGVTVTSVQ